MNIIRVKYCNGRDSVDLGKLTLKERRIFFEYAPHFLELGLQISPFKLPLSPGVRVCEDFLFDGLFGVFNDSLPDGWGRLLLDRKLMKIGIHPQTLTPLDRLRYVGSHGMGVFQYEPEIESDKVEPPDDLDKIAAECFEIF